MYKLKLDDGQEFTFDTPLQCAEKAVEIIGRPRFIARPGDIIIASHEIGGNSYYDMRSYFEPGAGCSSNGIDIYRSEAASINGFGACGFIREIPKGEKDGTIILGAWEGDDKLRYRKISEFKSGTKWYFANQYANGEGISFISLMSADTIHRLSKALADEKNGGA